jgi:hypothetical protein
MDTDSTSTKAQGALKDSTESSRVDRNRVIGWAIAIYFILFIGFTCLAWFKLSDAKGGQFGDSFGVFNAAFSGLGFVGLAVAIYLQYKQLQLQSEELRLQREELSLTREQLTRSAKAQEESESALRKQLEVMALGSRLDAVIILIRDEERHLREHHSFTQVESVTLSALETTLQKAVKGSVTNKNPDHSCFIQNLTDLIELKRELNGIHGQLRRISGLGNETYYR